MRKHFLFGLLLLLCCTGVMAQISLTGGSYTQDFNTLSNTAASTNNALTIPGWLMNETGGGARDNELYAVDPGGSNTGDTYSYGSAASTDRAFGGLRSGTLIPQIGAFFTNNTGSTITSLDIAFTGEQWRLGTAGRQDSIGFEYSTTATSLTTGTWTTVTALTFSTPTTATTGAKDGNAAANRTARNHTITGLNIPNGATFYIRWTDYDATGADDGLSVDDFSITPGSGAVTPVLSINDVSQAEGNSGLTDFVFTVSLSSPAGPGGVTFDIATADNTATIIGNDYSGRSTTGATISAGNTSYTFTVQVVGETIPEANETFFVNVTNVTGATVADGQGIGTIINDDVSLTPIHDIQGPGLSSPIVGATVTTSGIVIGRRSNGFFIQETDLGVDADPMTSEGIFVFTSSAPPAAAAIGNLVQVTGTVTEFIPGSDPNSPPQTEITSPSVLLLTTGNPLPIPVTLTAANTNPAGNASQLEPFENMRVLVNGFNVIAPTGGFLTESSATSTSNGLFYGVISLPRPFREPGINIQDPLPSGAPATVTRWDGNPEIVAVASNALGAPVLDVNSGATVNNLVGPLDFRNRIYTIDIDPTVPAVVNNNSLSYSAVPTPNSNELTVGSFNLQRFYDNVDDPGGDAVLTATAYNNRLNKASLAIRNALNTPDVLGVIEVENLAVLGTLANKINTDAVAAGDPNPNYTPYLIEGNDVGLIDVGFLVKSGRVTVNSVTQFGALTTYINPNNGLPETLNDRPPLVLDGTFTGVSCLTNNNFKVIVNHLRSLSGVDDPIDGNRIRTKKQQQAEFLANLIQGFQTADPTVKIVSVGDYNAFEFNDGYVDVVGTVKGTPTPAANVILASADLVNPNLVNLIDSYIPVLKYSYNFNGSAQTLDHILVNSNMSSRVSRFAIARLNADFPEVFRNDANRPERISDHDAAVAYFSFPATTPPVLTCPLNTTVAACQTQSAVNTAFANWLATASGSGGINGVLTNNNTGAPSACGGSTTVTFTYTNDCSPTTQTCTATFTVTPPATVVLTCPINTTVASCQTQAAVNTQFAAWLNTVSASGGCNGVLTNNNTGAPAACGGSTTVIFSYSSSCAPTNTCTATFTVSAPPTISITCPSALTLSCAASVPAPNTALVTVNAGCGVVVTFVSDVISAQTCANRFTVTRTYRATDVCGNTATCTQIITVNDQTPPVVTCPAPVTVSCASAVPAPNTALVTATDNCAGVITITHISDVISAQTCADAAGDYLSGCTDCKLCICGTCTEHCAGNGYG
ncbi:MAG: nuclease [Bacteroidetes bacterium]|nr:nuclease [Bacteroidota bacterium]